MSTRVIDAYDPGKDAADRHPGWTVRLARLHGIGEVIDVPTQLILVDPALKGPGYAVAHAIAHLDLEHITLRGGGSFTQQQEMDADYLASVRLDREDDRECA